MFCGIYFLKTEDQTNILRIRGLTYQITCSKEVKQNEIKKKTNKQTKPRKNPLVVIIYSRLEFTQIRLIIYKRLDSVELECK